jgi:hypothetical protein
MGYVALILIVVALVGLAVWDHRTRRQGHTFRPDGAAGIKAARRRDFRTGPSGTLTGIPIMRDPPLPDPPEDENRIRR